MRTADRQAAEQGHRRRRRESLSPEERQAARTRRDERRRARREVQASEEVAAETAFAATGAPRRRATGPAPATKRDRKVRLALWVTGALTVATIFGAATFHVLLVQSEFRLDKLNAEAADAQQRYEHLRLEVARLAAPERIVAAAQERLGMVVPTQVGYLTAPIQALAEPAGGRSNDDPIGNDPIDGTGDWSEVKPYLGSQP